MSRSRQSAGQPAQQPRWREFTVTRDGVRLAAYELGDRSAPTVVLVHGWPDTHHLWTHVAPTLAERYHVVAYDTRGYGASDKPAGVHPYRLEECAADLFAVAEAADPSRPVHLVGHDWGSVQAWEAVTMPGSTERFASFTSVSGPSLDQLGAWVHDRLTHPTPTSVKQALSQAVSSAYTALFQIPVLPKIVLLPLSTRRSWSAFLHAVEGTPVENVTVAPSLRADMWSGLRFYRANIRRKLAHPNPTSTSVPVFQVVNTRDIALRPAIYSDTADYADRLWRKDCVSGHWLPYTNPDYLASVAGQFIDSVETTTPSPLIDRSRRRGPAKAFDGTLSVVTGAASGIGRETALLLAANGSEVVVADIDADGAQETATAIKERGGIGHAYPLDVSDPAALAAFAADVATTHGVADVVVNNAGIGLGGASLDATDDQIRRLVDINLIGVMTGSREFGRQMVRQGIGGHIVNLASAAAFTPQRGLGAYAATKAGVLLFSESLRAELASDHIGVTAICPGIVDTNIISATELTGLSESEQAAARARIDRAYQRRGYTPDKVAAAIVAAIDADKAVVPVTPEAVIGYRIYRFTPWLSRLGARAKVM